MAIVPSLDKITTGYNLSKINSNFQNIADVLRDALSRSDTSPNSMLSQLDMNSNDIINGGDGYFENLFVDGTDIHEVVGLPGPKGDQGDKGDKGDKGDTGEQGIQGVQGIQGIQGIPGQDGVIDSIVEGTGIDVDATDPVNPEVSLDAASIASLSLADTAVQPSDIRTLNVSSYGAVGDGVTDDTTAVQAAINAASSAKVKLLFNAGETYKLTSTITGSGWLDVEATGAKFSIAHTGTGFNCSSSYAETKDLSSNYTIGTTSIAVNTMSSALLPGEPFKIVSDAVDGADRDSGSATVQYRTAEWAIATDGTTATSIAIEAPLRFVKGVSPTSTMGDETEVDAYTTTLNARVYRLERDRPFRWVGGEFYYDASIDITGSSGAKSAPVVIEGRVRPSIAKVSITRGGGPGISIAGNYLPSVDADVRNLTDDPSNGHYGYGVADSSFGSRVHVTGGNCRHLYTSSAPGMAADASTSPFAVGRTVGARISGHAYGAGASGVAPWDTHHSSDDVIFENCFAENCGSPGFNIRGRNIKLVNPTVRNCSSGVVAFTEYQSGDTDDDLYLAKKSQDYFTSVTIIDADIECVIDPLTVNFATAHISGNTRICSAGHRLLSNGGSEVHIGGDLHHRVTTLLGARAIQEQTGKGWVTMTDIVPAAAGAIPLSTTVFEHDSSVWYDASLATDALDDISVFDVAANCVLEANGKMELTLSGDFDFAEATGTLKSSGDAGWITYSFAGAADNAITQNIARTGLRVRALDGTLRWDGAQLAPGDAEKLLYANNNIAVTHTGTTSTANVYTPPQPQAAFIDEAGHYQRVELTLAKGGSAGTATCIFRAINSFNEQIVVPAGDAGIVMILEMFTRGDNSQHYRFELVSYNASGVANASVRSFKNRAFDIGGGSNFCTLAVTLASAADSIVVETVRVYGDKGGFN